MRFGRSQRLLGVGIVAVGLAVGPPVWWGLRSRTGEESQGGTAHPSGEAAEPDEVTALGTIQPFDGIVTISIPLADRIFDFEKGAEVGKEVKKGQPLVTLESAGERRLELALVNQQLEDAKARLRAALESGNAQIEAEKAKLNQLQQMDPLDAALQDLKVDLLHRQLDQAEINLRRVQGLQPLTVSSQEIEQQQMMASQARTELAAAKLRREKMTVAGVVNRNLVRASLAVAQAVLEKTKADISLAALGRQQELTQKRLDRTTIRAPQDGKILLIPVHRGELVGGQAPVLQMADTGRMAVIAEVYETDVRRVYEGQRAEVIVRALGGQTLYGNVVRVAGVVGRNQVLDVDPRAAVDRRVVDVKIELDEPRPASRLINHEVRVKLLPSSQRRP